MMPVTKRDSPELTEQPVAMAHQAVYDTVMQIVASWPEGTLLDVPAGAGALAQRLARAGFEVRGCDLYPEIFTLTGIEVRQGDLNTSLPYADQAFDYVTCIEGLEHIENPHQAIREFARMLKPGGYLVVSVPNILNIEERLKWLVHGYTSHFKPITREQVEKSRIEFGNREETALHINAISYTELRYLLEENGFRIVTLHRDKPKAHAWLYWPVVALIRLVARMTPEGKRHQRWTRELSSDEVLLGGNTLIVHAELSDGSGAGI